MARSPRNRTPFENRFLPGTILDDFPSESREVGFNHDFHIGKSRAFVRAESACTKMGSQNAIQAEYGRFEAG